MIPLLAKQKHLHTQPDRVKGLYVCVWMCVYKHTHSVCTCVYNPICRVKDLYLYFYVYQAVYIGYFNCGEEDKYERLYSLGLFFFLHFGFVLTAGNVYALLFSLRAEREEFVSKTKVKNWRLSMLPGFGGDTIVNSLQPGHFLVLWRKLSESHLPPPVKGFPTEPGLLQAVTWVRVWEQTWLGWSLGPNCFYCKELPMGRAETSDSFQRDRGSNQIHKSCPDLFLKNSLVLAIFLY